jgi:hypothetical protein
MGSVYAVRDSKLSRTVALKYLKREAVRENGAAASLFQREYHTLAQLRHPRVIQVYDYGFDGSRPFYTMELLDGSDLRELAPVPWRRACQLLRDVASSLALLHSRRLLHRDLSPRNVRCTRDGQAKLIDFGTMTNMGVPRDVAGTAPYMAPEAVHSHALDARTDLYALGTLAYWTLTGFDAYPARDTRELRALWMKPVVQPSTWVHDIPEALDALVMSLLSLDPQARPSHVAEVLERLTAIAGLEPIEHMDVARAYVATPTLIGHAETLASFHKRLVRAARGRGSALHIEGRPGHGRSRLIESLSLEAKLCGVTVVHAEGGVAQRGELAAIRTLLEGIADALPEQALQAFRPRAATLGHILPQLLDRLPAPPPPLEQRKHAAARVTMLDQAARAFIGEVSEQSALMLAVDDLDECDDASIVCLAWLGREAPDRKLVVCTSAVPSSPLRPLGALAQYAACVTLTPFDAEQTERLLRSVFGDAPHVRAAAEWVHALSQGVPGTILELVQYLVDHRIARYERGSWTLPDAVREQPLPANVEQAHDQLVQELTRQARVLASRLALISDHGPLDFDETVALGGFEQPDDTYRALLELEAARVVVSNAGCYLLRRRGLERALLKLLSAADRSACHARIAAIYGARKAGSRDEALLLQANHQLLSGDIASAFETVCKVSSLDGVPFGRSPASVALHVAALEYGKAENAPPTKLYGLQRALVQLSSSTDLSVAPLASGAMSRLLQDSGLGSLTHNTSGASDDESAAVARARETLALARLRFETTPAQQRGLDPSFALQELGYVAGVLASVHATRADAQALERLARDVAPLKPLSVGYEVLCEMIGQAADALSGQGVLARRLATLHKLEHAGIDTRARASGRVALSYWIAMDEAVLGKPSALVRAEELALMPSFSALAARVRSVFFLFSGDESGAEGCRKQRELFALNDPWGTALTDARGVIYEAWGYYLCGSVLGMRRVLAVVAEHAARLPAWQRDLCFVRGLYELLRGEPKRALEDLQHSGMRGVHALALLAAGDAAQARAVIDDATVQYREERFAPHRIALRAARALATAELEDPKAAAAQLEGDIAEAERDGVQGMLLCMLHETAARIAIDCDDRPAFRAHVRKLGATYGRGTSGLRARYEHLGAVARRALMSVPPPSGNVAEESGFAVPDVRTQLEPGGDRNARIERALRRLLDSAGAASGYLFGIQAGGLRLAGKLGTTAPPDGIEDMLGFYMNAELDSGSAVPHTATGTFSSSPVDLVAWINDGEQLLFPVLLSCVREQQRVIAGVALLGLDSQREPHVPEALIAEISHQLIDHGDVGFAKAAD